MLKELEKNFLFQFFRFLFDETVVSKADAKVDRFLILANISLLFFLIITYLH